MSIWATLYRFSIGMMVVLVLALVAYLFYPQVRKLHELKQRESRLDEDIRHQERLGEHARNKTQRLHSDPSFVERLARDELGLSRKGEVIFKVPEREE